MSLAEEKGASAWSDTLPIDKHGYSLQGCFSTCTRIEVYGWRPKGMPITCACGKSNNVDHALSCCKGGYVIMRHMQWDRKHHSKLTVKSHCGCGVRAHATATERRGHGNEVCKHRWQQQTRHQVQRFLEQWSRHILLCKGFQPPRAKPQIQKLLQCVSIKWEGEKKSIWAVNPWSGVWFLYPSQDECNWRPSSRPAASVFYKKL